MNKFCKIIDKLHLLFYEWDSNRHAFVPDLSYTAQQRYDELIKLTYELSLNKFSYEVQKDKSILVLKTNEGKGFVAKAFYSLLAALKIKKMNIYLLNDTTVKRAKNLPLFKLEHLKSDVDLSAYDALVFTSKNAVFALHSFNSAWKKVPAYAIAPQTAKTIKKLGGNLKFVGVKKHGNAFGYELIQELQGKKVLYVRGKKVVSDIVSILKEGGVSCAEMIVYENICDPEPKIQKLPKNSYIVFSSPSAIACFLEHYPWQKSYRAICIGETTAKHLPPEIKPHIADTTSIEACINKAVELELCR